MSFRSKSVAVRVESVVNSRARKPLSRSSVAIDNKRARVSCLSVAGQQSGDLPSGERLLPFALSLRGVRSEMSSETEKPVGIVVSEEHIGTVVWALLRQREHTEKMIGIQRLLGNAPAANLGVDMLREIDGALDAIDQQQPVV